jgi:HEAT repeat protein
MPTDAINDLLTKLSSASWNERETAAATLALLGETAKDALPQLRNQLIEDDDSDVRAAIVRAIAKIEQDKGVVVKEMLGSLGHGDWEVRGAAAEVLGSLGTVAKDALASLWTRLFTEDDDDVAENVARAIASIDEDKSGLVSKCIQFLQEGGSKKPQAAARVLAYMTPASSEKGKAADALLAAIKNSDDENFVQIGLKSLIKFVPSTVDLINNLLDDPKIDAAKKSNLILTPELAESLDQVWHTKSSVIVPLLVSQLGPEDLGNREGAIEWLTNKSEDLPTQFIDPIVTGLSQSFKKQGLGFSLLQKLGGPAISEQLLNDKQISPEIVGQTLLTEAQEVLTRKWNEDKPSVLPVILATLTSRNWPVMTAALTWLKDRAGEIPHGAHDNVVEALTRLQNPRIHPEVRNIAEAALIQLRQQERDIKTTPFIDVIRGSGKEDAKIEAIARLVEMGTRDALRALVNEWVQWIVRGEKALVEVTADVMRATPIAVQPLVDQLLHGWQPDTEFKSEIRAQLMPIEIRDVLQRVYDGSRFESIAEKELVNEWLLTIESSSEKIIDLKKAASLNKWPAERLTKEVIDILVAKEIQSRGQKVQFRITKQLADMSDPKFFEEDATSNHKRIRDELKRHAVPVLGRRLPKEENVEIRESMAQALGYIGGRESIDALSRAVAGEERLRTSRQELLAKVLPRTF